MTDIVERLLAAGHGEIEDEAAHEIERLRGLLREARDGLSEAGVMPYLVECIDAALAGTAPPTVLFDDRRDDPYLSPVGDQPSTSIGTGRCQPTLTECPACGNNFEKCMEVRAADQQGGVANDE